MPLTCKLDLFVKRAVSCHKLLLKDEQRLFKLHWEQRTAIYKKHMLVQEGISMAGPNDMGGWSICCCTKEDSHDVQVHRTPQARA